MGKALRAVQGKIFYPFVFRSMLSKKHKRNNAIIVMGDSHCNFFSGNENLVFRQINGFADGINFCCDKLPQFCTMHVGPALAYNLTKYGTETKAREKVEYLISKNYFKPKAKILCCFGEIDLRVHILRQAQKQNVSYEQVVDNVLNNYLEFLLFLSKKDYRPYCWAAIPTQKDDSPENPDYPRFGDEITRNKATSYFNKKLKYLCELNNIGFISIFDDLIDQDCRTKPEFLAPDKCHLSQKAMELAEQKLAEMLSVE